ncbi:Uncharacterised protein [Shigella sonnei]|nr:Uncharacterised protein [Shigella sonnei]
MHAMTAQILRLFLRFHALRHQFNIQSLPQRDDDIGHRRVNRVRTYSCGK